MAASCGVASAGKGLRYAEYSPPTAKLPDEQRLATVCWAWSNRRGRGLSGPRGASGLVEETDKKTGIGRYRARNFIAVGPGVTAFAFAGRYACQIWKTLGPVITETTKISTPSFSSYYKGGFEQKMSRCEASLILDVRWISLLSNQNK
ncbi:dnaJ homolog subfamily C member 15 isoform X2 [Tamandua tetradactyla]|uniref:dnaJ homolog subfamily C member 15 isoform X2 n=1 Tax=Tamandua tetradactyla TaxID=48850 RepID=UPI004053D537